MGRFNGWPHDYWRSIGWAELWGSLEEANQVQRAAMEADAHRSEALPSLDASLDVLQEHERQIAQLTGRPSPFAA